MDASPWLRPVQEFISPLPTPAGSPMSQTLSLTFSPAPAPATGPADFMAGSGLRAPAGAPGSAPPGSHVAPGGWSLTGPGGWNLSWSPVAAGPPPPPPVSVPAKLRQPGLSGEHAGDLAGDAAVPLDRSFEFGGENVSTGPAALRAQRRKLFAQSPEALRASGDAPPPGSAGKPGVVGPQGGPLGCQGSRRPFAPANLNLAHAAPAPAPGLAGDSQLPTPTLFAAHEGFEGSRGPSQAPGSGPGGPGRAVAAAIAAERGAAGAGSGADGVALQGAPGDAPAGCARAGAPPSAQRGNPAGSGALAAAEEGTWRIAAVGARSRSDSDSSGALQGPIHSLQGMGDACKLHECCAVVPSVPPATLAPVIRLRACHKQGFYAGSASAPPQPAAKAAFADESPAAARSASRGDRKQRGKRRRGRYTAALVSALLLAACAVTALRGMAALPHGQVLTCLTSGCLPAG